MQCMSMIVFALFSIVVDKRKVVSEIQTTTSWELVKPAYFNEDVILKCPITPCCLGTQWHGGKNNTLLSTDLLSHNKAKYEVRWEAKSSNLIIKSFGFEDGDASYTCSNRVSNCSGNLTINGNNFAFKPPEETFKKHYEIKNGYLNASVEFPKVYPEPVCNGTFEVKNEDITDHIVNNFINTSSFISGNITINHQICKDYCEGTITIDCRFGQHHQIRVLELMVDKAENTRTEKTSNFDYFYILLFFCGMLMGATFGCLCSYFRKNFPGHCQTKNQNKKQR